MSQVDLYWDSNIKEYEVDPLGKIMLFIKL